MKKIFFLVLLISQFTLAQTLNYSMVNFSADVNTKIVINKTNFENVLSKKKAGLAVLYSMLLPGMGELYANSYESGKYFTIGDAVLWGFIIGFNNYGSQMKDNYKSFAASYAGADIAGKDDNYFVNVGLYMNIDEYNKIKELERSYADVYNANYAWQWESQSERKEFRRMWKSSENAYNNIRFAAGALILNRIASAINAVRLVSRYNKNLSNDLSWNVNFDYVNTVALPNTIRFNFVSSF